MNRRALGDAGALRGAAGTALPSGLYLARFEAAGQGDHAENRAVPLTRGRSLLSRHGPGGLAPARALSTIRRYWGCRRRSAPHPNRRPPRPRSPNRHAQSHPCSVTASPALCSPHSPFSRFRPLHWPTGRDTNLGGVPVSLTANNQKPDGPDPDGSASIIAWTDLRSGSERHLRAAPELGGHAVVDSERSRSVHRDRLADAAAAIVSDGGGAILSWVDSRNVGTDIYAQHQLERPDLWASQGVAVCSAISRQDQLACAPTVRAARSSRGTTLARNHAGHLRPA